MALLKPQSLSPIRTDKRKRDLLAGPHTIFGFASCIADRISVHASGSAALAPQFPSPPYAFPHYNAAAFDSRNELLLKSVAIQMRVRGDANFFGIDPRAFRQSTNAKKPAADRDSKRIKDRGLPSGIVSHKQIEAWIEAECTVFKAVEVFDPEIVDPHS
jgi:hypothetical protein